MASLYEQLGKEEGIATAVELFYKKVLADDRLHYLFENTEMEKLKRHQSAFLTFATGGPNNYTGQNMKKAHEGLSITPEQFQAVASHLASTLEDLNVPEETIEQVINTVATLENDIVQSPSPTV